MSLFSLPLVMRAWLTDLASPFFMICLLQMNEPKAASMRIPARADDSDPNFKDEDRLLFVLEKPVTQVYARSQAPSRPTILAIYPMTLSRPFPFYSFARSSDFSSI